MLKVRVLLGTSDDEEKYSTALQRNLRKSIKLMKYLYNKL